MAWRRAVGIALILLVSVLWLSSSFIVKDLEDNTATSPFVITFLANALFIFFLPVALLRRWLCPSHEKTCRSDWDLFQSAMIVSRSVVCTSMRVL